MTKIATSKSLRRPPQKPSKTWVCREGSSQKASKTKEDKLANIVSKEENKPSPKMQANN